jgi:ABC exporter DevB family membrane fusion protein
MLNKMIERKSTLVAGGLLLLAAAAASFLLRSRDATLSAATSRAAVPGAAAPGWIAAPGRVEAASEEVRVSSELSGRLKSVQVEEGDRVHRGQVLAEIENADYQARLANAAATLVEREADLRRIVNGARGEERREALAAKVAARAVLDNAKNEAERRRNLETKGVISRDEADRYDRAYRVAEAEYEQASQHFAFVDAQAREEDRAKAAAEVESARAQLAEARAYYEKSFIRAPIDGVILRKLRHTGESVSTQFDSPVVTMADDSLLRVRLDVDETDVAKLRVGQAAYITAEAYGDRRFTGTVMRVGGILGRKNVRTEEPTEHVDTKILETLIQLDPGERLPLGLRVDGYVANQPGQ